MAELHYFPFFVEKWLSSSSISMMLPEQEGAYVRLLAIAWGDGSKEPSLPDDADTLARASRLGKRWGKLGALVRAQFEARDGLLYNAKLSEVWKAAQEKHASAVERGKKGAETRANKRESKTTSSASSSANTPAQAGTLATKNIDSPVSEPNGSERQESAPLALAPVGARPALPNGGVPGAPPMRDDADFARFNRRLVERAEEEFSADPDLAFELEAEARAKFAIKGTKPLVEWQARMVRSEMHELLRIRRGWKSFDEWQGERRGVA